MGNTAVKESRLNIRCDSHMRELLDKAATYSHVSVSEFVLSNALASAEKVVQANERITLRPEDFQAFLAALDAPAKPNAALQEAFERHEEQVSAATRYRIRALDSDIDTTKFHCGIPSLDEYIGRYASQDVRRNVARIFVATPENDPHWLAGFFALSAGSVSCSDLPESLAKRLPRYPVPVALIGRLAVANDFQGEGPRLDTIGRCVSKSCARQHHIGGGRYCRGSQE